MKDQIMQNNWVAYLRYWLQNIKDTSNPPTEEGFWLWYCMVFLEKQTEQEQTT